MINLRRIFLALVLSVGIAPAFAQAPPPVPALPDAERRTSYSISASLCSCSVGFALYADSTDVANWLEVYVNGVRLVQAGNWTITSPSGSLATLPRPITDAVLTFTNLQTGTVQIVGARRPRRTSQFQESAGVSARNLNQTFSDVIAMMRETWDRTNDVTGRVLMSPPGNILTLLPSPAACANNFLAFDVTGLNPVCIPGAGGGGGGGGGGGSVSSVTITAGNGLSSSGVCVITVSGNCILSIDPTYLRAGDGIIVSTAVGGKVSIDLRGYLSGLTFSNDGVPINIDIAPGQASSDDQTALMKLTSAMVKRTDATFVAGTGQGCGDTAFGGGDATIHFFLIKDIVTPAVDVLCSLSPTAPTLPGLYTVKRRIASLVRVSSAMRPFTQSDDMFLWNTQVDSNGALTNIAALTLQTIDVPTGIVVEPILAGLFKQAGAGSVDVEIAGVLPGGGNSAIYYPALTDNATQRAVWSLPGGLITNTAAQIYFMRALGGAATLTFSHLYTQGFRDTRNR